MDHKHIFLTFIITLAVQLAPNAPVNAAIYKCVSAGGETTYSQDACPEDSNSSRYSSVGAGVKKSNSTDCRLAQKFAETAGQAMRSGKSSGSVFNQYGGISSMSGPAVSIVNYVYTFEQNYQTTIERIGGLTRVRCENGSFGEASCEQFPNRFVTNSGGCDLSKIDVDQSDSQSNVPVENSEANVSTLAQRGISQEDYLVEQNRVHCKTNVLKKLEVVDKKSRTGMTAAEHDTYRAERSELRKEFQNC